MDNVIAELTRLRREVAELHAHERPSSAVFLATPLTSTSWDGDSYSTVAATLLDLSTVFGVPAGVKAVLARVECKDSGTWGTLNGAGVSLGPSATYYYEMVTNCYGGDIPTRQTAAVPCNTDGDIYYRLVASGSGTLDVRIEIWGYWL